MPTRNILFVLGHSADAQSTTSKALKERAFKAFGLLEEAVEARFFDKSDFPSFDAVMLCGGPSHPGQASEASMMAEILRGFAGDPTLLPELLLDEVSLNTLENITNGTRVLMEKYPEDELLLRVVTHDWHVDQVRNYWERSRYLAEARRRCRLDFSSPVRAWNFHGVRRLIRQLATLESAWDPNRILLNRVRPHAL